MSIEQKINPHGGMIANASGTVIGKFLMTDCFVLHGFPSSKEITAKPINLFPTDCPPYIESQTHK